MSSPGPLAVANDLIEILDIEVRNNNLTLPAAARVLRYTLGLLVEMNMWDDDEARQKFGWRVNDSGDSWIADAFAFHGVNLDSDADMEESS